MSKLFKALESLEKHVEEKDSPQQKARSVRRKRKDSKPFLKILLMLLIFVVAGLVLLGGAWMFFGSTMNISGIFSGGEAVVMDNQSNSLPDGTNDPLPIIPEPVTETAEVIYISPIPPGKIIKNEESEQERQQTITRLQQEMQKTYRDVAGEKVGGSIGNAGTYGVDINREKMPVVLSAEKKMLEIRVKKLVYQAEKARQRGDIASATRIFHVAWDLHKNSEVANNLAATLMQQQKYTEALVILNEGLQIAPEDPDLLYNRNVARENL